MGTSCRKEGSSDGGSTGIGWATGFVFGEVTAGLALGDVTVGLALGEVTDLIFGSVRVILVFGGVTDVFALGGATAGCTAAAFWEATAVASG